MGRKGRRREVGGFRGGVTERGGHTGLRNGKAAAVPADIAEAEGWGLPGL